MKIAYVIPFGSILSGKSNGVRIQAEGWAEQLRQLGNEVTLISMWQDYDWDSFDLLHFFGMTQEICSFIKVIRERYDNKKIIFSPIIDTTRRPVLSYLAHFARFNLLHMESPWSCLYAVAKEDISYSARSLHEKNYIQQALKVRENRIFIDPLAYRMPAENIERDRENICFHVSLLCGPHKNVRRLVQAAIKYKFELVLAGKYGSVTFKDYLDDIQKRYPNIKYLGRISDEELLSWYYRAKCFALPSLMEGVGLVALDAAACGCDVVLTDRGAPKEYYDGKCFLVNPESVDDIGLKIMDVLQGKTYQPELGKMIREQYSPETLAKQLLMHYYTILSR